MHRSCLWEEGKALQVKRCGAGRQGCSIYGLPIAGNLQAECPEMLVVGLGRMLMQVAGRDAPLEMLLCLLNLKVVDTCLDQGRNANFITRKGFC